MKNSTHKTRIESDIKTYFGNWFKVSNIRDLDKYITFQDQNSNNYYAKKSRNSINVNSIRRDR